MSSDDCFWRLFIDRMKKLGISPDDISKKGDGAIERFEKINFSETEVKHVSFHDNQNRDTGSRNSKKDAIRFEI